LYTSPTANTLSAKLSLRRLVRHQERILHLRPNASVSFGYFSIPEITEYSFSNSLPITAGSALQNQQEPAAAGDPQRKHRRYANLHLFVKILILDS
jgi:hypothetical protein